MSVFGVKRTKTCDNGIIILYLIERRHVMVAKKKKEIEKEKNKPCTYYIYTLSTQTKVKIPYINLIIASGTVYPCDGGTVSCRQLYFYSWNYIIYIYIQGDRPTRKVFTFFFFTRKFKKRIVLNSHGYAVLYRFFFF